MRSREEKNLEGQAGAFVGNAASQNVQMGTDTAIDSMRELLYKAGKISKVGFATVYKGNIIKNLIMDCQSYAKYRPNETTGGIFVSWRRKEELPTGA